MREEIVAALRRAPDNRLTRADLWNALPGLNGRPNDAYYDAEQALVDEGRIERRRGRRGGIYLLPPAEDVAEEADGLPLVANEIQVEREIEHYQPALNEILENWTEQPGFTHVFGSITGMQGRRATGGRWSRPDIVLCTISDWLFSSRPEGDVRTIEVKRFEATDVVAVYEAVSHKARSHYAYLLIVNFPAELNDDQQKDFDLILSTAGQHGIGVITAVDTSDWGTWEFQLYPTRSSADHQAINDLLFDQVPPNVREDFRNALRQIIVRI